MFNNLARSCLPFLSYLILKKLSVEDGSKRKRERARGGREREEGESERREGGREREEEKERERGKRRGRKREREERVGDRKDEKGLISMYMYMLVVMLMTCIIPFVIFLQNLLSSLSLDSQC